MSEEKSACSADNQKKTIGRILSESEAELVLGRCGPSDPRHKVAPQPQGGNANATSSGSGSCSMCRTTDNPNPKDQTSSTATGSNTGETCSNPILDIGSGEYMRDIELGLSLPGVGALPGDEPLILHRSFAPGNRRMLFTGMYLEEDAGNNNITAYARYGGKYKYTYSAGSYAPENGVYTKLSGSAGGPWTEEYPEGVTHVYEMLGDGYGHIRKRYDRHDNAVYYEYDANSKQIGVQSTSDLGTYFEYDGNGNATKAWDYKGRTTYMEYDGSDNLVKIARAGGCTNYFAYNGDQRITAIEDADGFVTYYEYGGDDYLDKVSRDDAASGQTRYTYYEYPSIGSEARMIDPRERTTYFELDGDYNIKSVKNGVFEETKKGWTGNDELSRRQDALGNTTYLEYDVYGNVSKRTDALDNSTTHEYRADQELLKTTDALGGVREYDYDAQGNRTTKVDELGNVTYFEHNSGGQLTKTTNALGQTQERTYDSYGELLTSEDGRGNVTTHGHEWDYDGQGGRRESAVDANSNESYFLYDACDRQVKAVDELGDYTESGYDSRGNLTISRNKLGDYTYFDYNAFNEQTRRRQEVSGQWEETITYYDIVGQVYFSYDAEGQASYFQYDNAGRQIQSSDALGRASQSGYDKAGRQVRTTDPEGAVTYMLYDQASRQIGTAGPASAAEITSVSLQEGVGGYTGAKDTYLYRPHPNNNYGSAEALIVFRNTYRSLLKFAIFESEGGPVPDEAMIVSATLNMYKYSNYHSLVSAYEVLKSWEDDQATWNQASDLEEWDAGGCQAPGEDRVAERVDWGTLNYSSGQWMELDVTRSLLRWTSGMLTNNGWVLDDWSPNDKVNYRRYRSSDYAADSSLRPKLEIVYTERGSYNELDANGRTTQSWSTGLGIGKTDYDAAGNVTEERDALNNATDFENDALNRQTKVIAADGGETTTEYDAAGNQTRTTDPLGNETLSSYDKLNRQEWQRDAAGNYTYFEYTDRSEQKYVIDPRNGRTESVYDAAGRVIWQMDQANVATYYYYDEANRNVLTHLAALDHVTYMVYDRAGRQTHTKTTPNGTEVYDAEEVYDAAGQVVRSVDARGNATYYTYDSNGRAIEIKDALLNETLTTYDPAGNMQAVASPRGYTTYFGHDYANRLARSEDPEGVVSYFDYDDNGNLTSATVGVGAGAHSTRFSYDQVGRQDSMTAPDGGVVSFEYDLNGSLVLERNAISSATKYGYDERSLLVRIEDSLGQTTYYEYDETRNLTRSKSPAERVGDFTYDLARRRTRASYSNGFVAYFAYDAVGNMLRVQEVAEGAVYFSYDRMNRILNQSFAVEGAAYYAYDENSNRLRLQYPSGGTAYYTYDEVDRIAEVKAPSGNSTIYEYDASSNRTKSVWGNGAYSYYCYDKAERIESIRHLDDDDAALAYFDYARDSRANIISISRLDGIATYYGYDQADRLVSEVWKESGGAALYAFSYDYDKAGNRLSGTVLGEDIFWQYDDAGAITRRIDDSGTSYYAYDLDGNLEVLQEGGGAITYFEHGGHGLATKIKPLGGTELTFDYDGLLRRTRMTEGATTTYFRHDGINFIEISDSLGSVTKLTHGYSKVDGAGSVVEIDKDSVLYYLHQDHRGTTQEITDSNGDVVWSGLCDAWGLPVSEVGSNPGVFWYQGQAWWRLAVHGRSYYLSPTRIYAPSDGVFIERDPISRPDFSVGRSAGPNGVLPFGREGLPTTAPGANELGVAWSQYAYAMSSPVAGVDPTGLKPGFDGDLEATLRPFDLPDKVLKCCSVETQYIALGMVGFRAPINDPNNGINRIVTQSVALEGVRLGLITGHFYHRIGTRWLEGNATCPRRRRAPEGTLPDEFKDGCRIVVVRPVIVGHSWGGHAAIVLSNRFAARCGMEPQLLVSIDAVHKPTWGACGEKGSAIQHVNFWQTIDSLNGKLINSADINIHMPQSNHVSIRQDVVPTTMQFVRWQVVTEPLPANIA